MFRKTGAAVPPFLTDPREAVNSRRRDFLDFLVKSSSSAVALAVTGSLAACGGADDEAAGAPPAPPVPSVFAFGVASGDPLADRVILWTHAKIPASAADVSLSWQWRATPPSAVSCARAACWPPKPARSPPRWM